MATIQITDDITSASFNGSDLVTIRYNGHTVWSLYDDDILKTTYVTFAYGDGTYYMDHEFSLYDMMNSVSHVEDETYSWDWEFVDGDSKVKATNGLGYTSEMSISDIIDRGGYRFVYSYAGPDYWWILCCEKPCSITINGTNYYNGLVKDVKDGLSMDCDIHGETMTLDLNWSSSYYAATVRVYKNGVYMFADSFYRPDIIENGIVLNKEVELDYYTNMVALRQCSNELKVTVGDLDNTVSSSYVVNELIYGRTITLGGKSIVMLWNDDMSYLDVKVGGTLFQSYATADLLANPVTNVDIIDRSAVEAIENSVKRIKVSLDGVLQQDFAVSDSLDEKTFYYNGTDEEYVQQNRLFECYWNDDYSVYTISMLATRDASVSEDKTYTQAEVVAGIDCNFGFASATVRANYLRAKDIDSSVLVQFGDYTEGNEQSIQVADVFANGTTNYTFESAGGDSFRFTGSWDSTYSKFYVLNAGLVTKGFTLDELEAGGCVADYRSMASVSDITSSSQRIRTYVNNNLLETVLVKNTLDGRTTEVDDYWHVEYAWDWENDQLSVKLYYTPANVRYIAKTYSRSVVVASGATVELTAPDGRAYEANRRLLSSSNRFDVQYGDVVEGNSTFVHCMNLIDGIYNGGGQRTIADGYVLSWVWNSDYTAADMTMGDKTFTKTLDELVAGGFTLDFRTNDIIDSVTASDKTVRVIFWGHLEQEFPVSESVNVHEFDYSKTNPDFDAYDICFKCYWDANYENYNISMGIKGLDPIETKSYPRADVIANGAEYWYMYRTEEAYNNHQEILAADKAVTLYYGTITDSYTRTLNTGFMSSTGDLATGYGHYDAEWVDDYTKLTVTINGVSITKTKDEVLNGDDVVFDFRPRDSIADIEGSTCKIYTYVNARQFDCMDVKDSIEAVTKPYSSDYYLKYEWDWTNDKYCVTAYRYVDNAIEVARTFDRSDVVNSGASALFDLISIQGKANLAALSKNYSTFTLKYGDIYSPTSVAIERASTLSDFDWLVASNRNVSKVFCYWDDDFSVITFKREGHDDVTYTYEQFTGTESLMVDMTINELTVSTNELTLQFNGITETTKEIKDTADGFSFQPANQNSDISSIPFTISGGWSDSKYYFWLTAFCSASSDATALYEKYISFNSSYYRSEIINGATLNVGFENTSAEGYQLMCALYNNGATVTIHADDRDDVTVPAVYCQTVTDDSNAPIYDLSWNSDYSLLTLDTYEGGQRTNSYPISPDALNQTGDTYIDLTKNAADVRIGALNIYFEEEELGQSFVGKVNVKDIGSSVTLNSGTNSEVVVSWDDTYENILVGEYYNGTLEVESSVDVSNFRNASDESRINLYVNRVAEARKEVVKGLMDQGLIGQLCIRIDYSDGTYDQRYYNYYDYLTMQRVDWTYMYSQYNVQVNMGWDSGMTTFTVTTGKPSETKTLSYDTVIYKPKQTLKFTHQL